MELRSWVLCTRNNAYYLDLRSVLYKSDQIRHRDSILEANMYIKWQFLNCTHQGYSHYFFILNLMQWNPLFCPSQKHLSQQALLIDARKNANSPALDHQLY